MKCKRPALTLHNAMVRVLEPCKDLVAEQVTIAERINELKLYWQMDGSPVKSGQIGARAKNYPHLFEKIPADRGTGEKAKIRLRDCTVGILAYGSISNDPGAEIEPSILRRIRCKTPFDVEYARLSEKRKGAPTVIRYSPGCEVNATVLVLSDDIPLDEAKNMLYRREIGGVGSGKEYKRKPEPNAVVIECEIDFWGLQYVLYTDFNQDGKKCLDPEGLAEAAIKSAKEAKEGEDGISYLMDRIKERVVTPLTPAYKSEILKQTGAASLEEALGKVRQRIADSAQEGLSPGLEG